MKQDRRFGLQLGLANIYFLLGVGIITVVVTALLDLALPAVWAGIAVIALLLGVATYRSRTVLGWLGRRVAFRRSSRKTTLAYEWQNAGITWDGERACAYVEVLPQPFATTVVGTEPETTIESLPLDAIREELVQFDIHCEAITVVTVGHKFATLDELATAYRARLGPVPGLLYGRTFVEVAIRLADSLDSVYARMENDDVPAGISRAVKIAGERIRRRIAHAGWKTHVLDKADLRGLHNEIAEHLAPALRQEHWGSCGPKTMRAVAFTPGSSAWTTKNYREWCQLYADRQIHITRLEHRRGVDHAEMYVGFLSSDPTTLTTVPALGLRREYGQQGNIFTAALPMAQTVDTTGVPGKDLLPDAKFPIDLTPGGIGTLIGHTKTRAQVFVNFTTGGADPFYVIGPAVMCQQLLVWLATSGRNIDITLPGEEWKRFAKRIGVSYQENPEADIIVSTEGDLKDPVSERQVRIVWATAAPTIAPTFAIVAGRDENTLHTPTAKIGYQWSISTAEEAFFTVDKPPRRAPNPARPAPRPSAGRMPPEPRGRHAAVPSAQPPPMPTRPSQARPEAVDQRDLRR